MNIKNQKQVDNYLYVLEVLKRIDVEELDASANVHFNPRWGNIFIETYFKSKLVNKTYVDSLWIAGEMFESSAVEVSVIIENSINRMIPYFRKKESDLYSRRNNENC